MHHEEVRYQTVPRPQAAGWRCKEGPTQHRATNGAGRQKPKLSETDRERVWEKVNPLMYRVHHGQPSLEEIVSCLAEYDKSRPLRDFITSWAVQWLGGIELKKRAMFAGSHAHARSGSG